MQEVDKLKEALARIVMSGIIFLSSYFIIVALMETPYSDFTYHSEVAKNFSWSNIKNELLNGNTYFMWSSLVSFVFHHCKVSIEGASAVVTAGANVLTLNIVWEYFKRKMPQIHDAVLLFFCGGLLVVGPLFFPWINSAYYFGTWSPNVWHNPTTNIVKPFAIAAFLLIIKLIEEQKANRKDYCILSAVLALSVVAKPSFLQGIVPALVIVVIIDIISMKKIRFNKWMPLAVTFVPAGIIMLFQLWITFYSNNTVSEGIGIEYMRVLKQHISNEWIALIACIAFPLYILISERKNIKHNYKLILVMSYLVTTWCEMAFLYEKGIREGHANFAWGYILSIFSAWVVCTAIFVENIYNKKYTSGKMKIGLGLFSVHMLLGIWFLISIYRNQGIF